MEQFKAMTDNWGFGGAVILGLAFVVKSLFTIILAQFQSKDTKLEKISEDYLNYVKKEVEKAEKRENRLLDIIAQNVQVNGNLVSVLTELKEEITYK